MNPLRVLAAATAMELSAAAALVALSSAPPPAAEICIAIVAGSITDFIT
jgi:hypothetical protein